MTRAELAASEVTAMSEAEVEAEVKLFMEMEGWTRL
jgi:hypothetical protein